MSNSLQKMIQNQAYAIVYWQLAGVAALACLAVPFSDLKTAFSLLCGGLAYGLPNLLFVWRVFRYTRAQEMNHFMAAFYAGEILKLLFSGILFLLVVKYLPVRLLSVLTGFAGAILFFRLACMSKYSKQNK